MSNTLSRSFLHYVLLVDALLSGTTGLIQVLATGWLAGLLHLPAPLLLWSGLVLMVYASLVAYLAFRQDISRSLVWTVIVVNLLWAIDCLVLLASGWVDPNWLGIGWVMLQVMVVVVFAELQYIAIRRSATPLWLKQAEERT